MGFLRKATWVATGGASGLVIKANSKKERTLKAIEQQNKLLEMQLQADSGNPSAIPSGTQPITRDPSALTTEATVAHSSKALVGIADEIRKLAELRDAGLLTEEEFQRQKGRWLTPEPPSAPTVEEFKEYLDRGYAELHIIGCTLQLSGDEVAIALTEPQDADRARLTFAVSRLVSLDFIQPPESGGQERYALFSRFLRRRLNRVFSFRAPNKIRLRLVSTLTWYLISMQLRSTGNDGTRRSPSPTFSFQRRRAEPHPLLRRNPCRLLMNSRS